MQHWKVLAHIFMLIGLISPSKAAAPAAYEPLPVVPGEQLTYVLEYMTMDLATLTFTVLPPVDTLGTTLYHVRAELNSNPAIPILKLKNTYESYFDAAFRPYAVLERGINRKHLFRKTVEFDYTAAKMCIREFETKGRDEKLLEEKVETLQGPMFDSLTMFYYLRAQANRLPFTAPEEVRVLTQERVASIAIAAEQDRPRCEFLGETFTTIPLTFKFGSEDIAGLRDEASFRYSIDEIPLPLQGEIKVFVGKVKVELTGYVAGSFGKPEAFAADKAAVLPTKK